MAQPPPVSESTDVPTSFGTVRAYRFDGPSAAPPVVLLPGRNASTPMWRVNIPALPDIAPSSPHKVSQAGVRRYGGMPDSNRPTDR
jgi:hypothetical protein